MLPKKSRLFFKKESKQIRKEGKTLTGPLFGLVVARQKEIKETKFGFVVSRKVDKRAVVRNRLKRILSEAVGRLLPRVDSGYNVVFLARKALVGKGLEEVKKETERMFKKARLVKEDAKDNS